MILNTASEGVSLAKKLESDSAGFYEEFARQDPQHAETFLSFARENKKNIANIDRVYYGVITDAIEGSYAFCIESDDCAINVVIPATTNNRDLLQQALSMEETIIKFYSEASKQSDSLMADLPRAFTLIAKKHASRLSLLKSILAETK
jgi:hypothetical protein